MSGFLWRDYRILFKRIPSVIGFYPEYDHDVAEQDPLWNSRIIMDNFRENGAAEAVPTGVMFFEEYKALQRPY